VIDGMFGGKTVSAKSGRPAPPVGSTTAAADCSLGHSERFGDRFVALSLEVAEHDRSTQLLGQTPDRFAHQFGEIEARLRIDQDRHGRMPLVHASVHIMGAL